MQKLKYPHLNLSQSSDSLPWASDQIVVIVKGRSSAQEHSIAKQ